jgi:TRAP-type mannitol/chloroaromatic compound transport system permease small subunit
MKGQLFDTIYTRYGVFVKWFGLGAGISAFLMMFLIFADIIGRKFFNRPVEGAYEITESLLTFIIYLGVAYTQFEKGHVRVTLFTDRLKPKAQNAWFTIVYFIGCLFFVYAAYCMFCFAWDSWLVREVKWGTVEYPLYPVKAIAGAGMFLLGIQFLMDSIRELFHFVPQYKETNE